MIYFELNGEQVQYDGDPSARLLDVLRNEFQILGPKEGCGEGECGACSVLIDGKLMNACLVAMGNLGGANVLTIEGYRETKKYQVLEETFAKAGAVQCGFCTPGMIMAAEALLSKNPNPDREAVQEAISGNLCRCTGYNMIIDAILMAARQGGRAMVKGLYPTSLQEALFLKRENKEAKLYAGGTDLMVVGGNWPVILFLNQVQELKRIEEDTENIYLGAGCTYTELLENTITPDILRAAIGEIASPGIRNMGTIGGNVCNASPAGDTLVVLYALSARVKIASLNEAGEKVSREIPIQQLITGVRKLSLGENEIVESIMIHKSNYQNMTCTYYKKVGTRRAQAISKLSFAGLMKIENNKIKEIRIAFGSVGPTVVRAEELEQQWIGTDYQDFLLQQEPFIQAYADRIHPIDDQRSTAIYRKKACLNLLKDFILFKRSE